VLFVGIDHGSFLFFSFQREVHMIHDYAAKGSAATAHQLYHIGQHIIYKGEKAQVLETKPVFTIRIQGKSHVICGNIFGDIQPSDDRVFNGQTIR
jgi:hypothetical protein